MLFFMVLPAMLPLFRRCYRSMCSLVSGLLTEFAAISTICGDAFWRYGYAALLTYVRTD